MAINSFDTSPRSSGFSPLTCPPKRSKMRCPVPGGKLLRALGGAERLREVTYRFLQCAEYHILGCTYSYVPPASLSKIAAEDFRVFAIFVVRVKEHHLAFMVYGKTGRNLARWDVAAQILCDQDRRRGSVILFF